MKKITKFLDSVMGGIKRTCVAKALAVFAVASVAINVNAQTTNEQSVITGIDKLVGIPQKDLLENAITFTTDKDLKFPTDSKYHFFLYNVKTGRFLNAGGYWGTHASLKEYGEPIAIVNSGTFKLNGQSFQKIKLVMDMHGTEGKFVGYPGVYDQTNPDRGVYVDRKSKEVFGWVLEPVTGEGKGNNTYKLYTCCVNNYGNTVTTKKYYLCSNKGQVDVDRNCEAYPESSLSEYAGYDEWRFISYTQIHNLQEYNGDNLTDALELSFMLKCPGFSRGDNDITSWHTYNFNTGKSDVAGFKNGFAMYGLSKYYNYIAGSETKPSEKIEDSPTWKNELSSTAYEFDGIKYATNDGDWDNYRRNLGKYYCASITNKRGIVYQNVDVTMPGTYKIECNGYSTTKKATLFAGVIDPGNKNKMLNGSLNTTFLNQTGDMSQTVQNELHISEKNMDYAGKSFYSGNYSNSVYVTVPENAIVDGKATIRLGIMVGYPDTDTAVEGDEWTVFDKFHILYASRTYEEDLILDEHRDNLNYLMDLKPMKNKTLRLKKDFTLNKWNSFILPVNLTKKQVIETFGASARLAKLTNLTETGIEFTSVKLTGDNETALEAYVPYLIFPVKGADQTKAYTAKYEQNATTKRLLVNIGDNHYVIDKVSMQLTADGKKNDFSKMDREHWTTTVTGGNEDIKAYGTFARTFGSEQTDNENGTYTWEKNGNIIEGRDKLIDCYFFDKGNMYHSATRPRGLRGFSCWFKMAEGAQQSLRLTIDGVSQGTTGIEDILADYEQPVSRFANGIYNLNGQLVKQGNSTAGLPSGMYIVNGKKCIVR
mgnify:FL=1